MSWISPMTCICNIMNAYENLAGRLCVGIQNELCRPCLWSNGGESCEHDYETSGHIECLEQLRYCQFLKKD
jgi:hypothetical protein